jgi:hypothetical protein
MKRTRSDSKDVSSNKLNKGGGKESSDKYMYVVLEVPHDVISNHSELTNLTFDIEVRDEKGCWWGGRMILSNLHFAMSCTLFLKSPWVIIIYLFLL